MVNRDLCLPSNTMHTFVITDSESNGIQSPGYYSISMNGRDIARGSTFNEAGVSIFLAGDSASCSDAESRLELEILFHDFPDTISWDIRHVFTNTIVVNQAVTQGFEAATYWAGTYSFFGERCTLTNAYQVETMFSQFVTPARSHPPLLVTSSLQEMVKSFI